MQQKEKCVICHKDRNKNEEEIDQFDLNCGHWACLNCVETKLNNFTEGNSDNLVLCNCGEQLKL